MKRFAAAFLAVSLALSVAACGTWDAARRGLEVALTTTVTQRQAYLAIQGFDAVKIIGTNYLDLRRCRPDGSNAPFCRDPAKTPSLIAAIRSGTSSRNNLKADLRRRVVDEDAAISAVSDYNGIQAASSTIEAITGAYRAAVEARVR